MSLLSDASGLFDDLGKAVNGYRAFEKAVDGPLSYPTQPPPAAPTPTPSTTKGMSPWVWVGVGGLALILLLRR